MLTKHQKKHLEAVILDTVNHSKAILGPSAEIEYAKSKDVDIRDYQAYLDFIKDAAQGLLDSATWPGAVIFPADIHPYLEKNKSFRTFDGEAQING